MVDIPTPFPLDGHSALPTFATLDSMIVFYARWMPAPYLHGVIEAEKEVFVVRKDCSLGETHVQFLRKCESALARAVNEAQAGRAGWDWSWVPAAGSDTPGVG
ncbi:MAG: hypothetical protein JF616_16890 [Fibrobacteres bacterium]|nr:hypothetical protein [Fibrobacterota bacterium]